MSFQYRNKVLINYHIKPTARGDTAVIPLIPLIEQLINEKP